MPSTGPGGASRQRVEAAAAAWERLGDPRSLRALAAALVGAGRAQSAITLLGQHAAWVADDPGLLRVRATALARAGRTQEAAEAFEALAELLEQDAGPGWQGDAPAAGRGRDRPAAGRAAPTSRDAPSHPGGLAAWARAEATDCRLRGQPPAEAAEQLRRLLLVSSVRANPYAVALYGRLLVRAGQPAAGAQALLEATAALPEDGGIAAAAAFAVRRARGPAASLPMLLRALRIRPDQRPVLATLVADAIRLHRAAQTRTAVIELARRVPEPGPLWNAIDRLGTAAARWGVGDAAASTGHSRAPAEGRQASRAGRLKPTGHPGDGHGPDRRRRPADA